MGDAGQERHHKRGQLAPAEASAPTARSGKWRQHFAGPELEQCPRGRHPARACWCCGEKERKYPASAAQEPSSAPLSKMGTCVASASGLTRLPASLSPWLMTDAPPAPPSPAAHPQSGARPARSLRAAPAAGTALPKSSRPCAIRLRQLPSCLTFVPDAAFV